MRRARPRHSASRCARYAAAALAAVEVPTPSDVVARHVGTPSVAEAAALLAAHGELVVTKRRSAHATCAVAKEPEPWPERSIRSSVESYRILRSRIDLSHLPPLSRAVAERVIHAAADLSLRRHPGPRRGSAGTGPRRRCSNGAPIYCDARMVAAGITSRTADRPARRRPRATPRRHDHPLRRRDAPGHVARRRQARSGSIGNAPTALAELIAHPPPEPALIVGLPVGFVGAAEAKAALAAVAASRPSPTAASAAGRRSRSPPSTRSCTSTSMSLTLDPRRPPQRQERVRRSGSPASGTYIATGAATDAEMAARIAAHQARRGAEWTTIEAGDELEPPAGTGPARRPRRLDRRRDAPPRRVRRPPAPRSTRSSARASKRSRAPRTAPLIVVAEEAGLGPVPAEAATRRWLDLTGDATQALSATPPTASLAGRRAAAPLEPSASRRERPHAPSAARRQARAPRRRGLRRQRRRRRRRPAWLTDAVADAWEGIGAYPDETARDRSRRARATASSPRSVLVLNGAAEGFWLLAAASTPTRQTAIVDARVRRGPRGAQRARPQPSSSHRSPERRLRAPARPRRRRPRPRHEPLQPDRRAARSDRSSTSRDPAARSSSTSRSWTSSTAPQPSVVGHAATPSCCGA